MIKIYIVFLIISLSISFVVGGTTQEDCDKESNTTCEICLKVPGCSFCKDKKLCFPTPSIPTEAPCSFSDYQTKTCYGNAQIYLIVFGSIGGVLLLAVLVVICCCCKKCRQRSLQNDDKRRRKSERELEDRRVAAEIRTAERNDKADQIRMKYGLFKGKDSAVEYRRMS